MKKLITICLLILTMFLVNAQSDLANKPEVVIVTGGTFTMGSNVEKDETPYSVTLSSYSIGKYPVTVGQYKKYCTATGTAMPKSPSWGWNDKHPIVNVKYYETVSYCNWLGEQYGGVWSLPIEAQWEFAARGGNKSQNFTYSGSNDLDEIAWYSDNAGGKTQIVGRKKTNELGIYDMSGNIWEWCKDRYGENYYTNSASTNPKGPLTGPYIVFRGGSWDSSSSDCRVAKRTRNYLYSKLSDCGFRVVLSK